MNLRPSRHAVHQGVVDQRARRTRTVQPNDVDQQQQSRRCCCCFCADGVGQAICCELPMGHWMRRRHDCQTSRLDRGRDGNGGADLCALCIGRYESCEWSASASSLEMHQFVGIRKSVGARGCGFGGGANKTTSGNPQAASRVAKRHGAGSASSSDHAAQGPAQGFSDGHHTRISL